MRMLALILTVLAATMLIAPASQQDKVNPSRKDQKEASAKKVKELQKERIATLKEMADAITELYRSGHVGTSYGEVLEARLLVFKAELDAAEKQSDRITLYKNIVDLLKKYEDFAKTRVRSPRSVQDTMSSFLKVKAMRLEAEINLEREKAKEAKEAK
jgi:hypothetical protein